MFNRTNLTLAKQNDKPSSLHVLHFFIIISPIALLN